MVARMSAKPSVSIVVCTRNRGDRLRQTLQKYEQIRTSQSWELVIVNNGSTDTTAQRLSEFGASTAIAFQVFDEARPGLSRARNAGWRRARSNIVAFTDDDCYPAPDFVDAIAAGFAEQDLGFIGGRVLLHDPEDYAVTVQLGTIRIEFAPLAFIESGLILGANMATRTDVLHEMQGFDEMLGAGTCLPSAEDVDFINRVSAAGYRGVYDPRVVVAHHHQRRTQSQVAALMKSYDTGRGAYYMKGVLDASRRSQMSRQWYWRTFLPAARSKRAVRRLASELSGAAQYLWLRAKGSLSSGSQEPARE